MPNDKTEVPMWMKRYRDLLVGTEGEKLEDILSSHHSYVADPELAKRHAGVVAQVTLLMRLRRLGLLAE